MKLSTADLLRAGKRERMRESARAHMADAVATSMLGAAGAGSAAAVSAKTLLSAKAWLVLSVGTILVGLVGSFGGWRAWTSDPATGTLTLSVAAGPALASTARSLRVPLASPLTDATASATASKPQLEAAPNHRAESEVASLEHVRERLRAGAPAEALALLAIHSRKFPRGYLLEEARVLRVRALVGTDPPKARGEAAAFLRESPNSPYRAQMERIANP